ncbi:MAG: nucleotidyltransferase substrate binding protein [Lachnospiraceae bacterium]|nr:nucleotidyltransferase substrate binding protein [Lachnospiraceae bacterium]
MKKMISDEELWLDALVSRNNVAHAYNQAIAMDIIRQNKEKYYDMFIQLQKKIEQDWLYQRKQRLQMINLIL